MELVEELDHDYTDLLDDTTWIDILDNLDGQSLIRLSAVSPKFKEILQNSKVLMKKIKFCINFPEEAGEELKKIKKGLETCITNISRKYLNLQINRLRNRILGNEMRGTFFSIISSLSLTVTNLEIYNCYISRNDFTVILQSFGNLVELKLDNLLFSDNLMPSEIVELNRSDQRLLYPNLKILRLIQCDFYCLLLLKTHNKLHTLEISIPSYNRPDVEEFENFLLIQTSLKNLKLTHFRFNSTYSTDRLANVPFQLDKLSLKDVSWDIDDHCSLFLKSQNNLKHFELRRFRSWIMPRETKYHWFCGVMKHILIDNRLEKLVIDTNLSSAYIEDSEFLPDMCNKNVKHLTYIRDNSDTSELFMIFTRVFPNTQTLVLTDFPQAARQAAPDVIQNLHYFKELKELDITAKPGSMANFSHETAKSLTSFYFHATNEDKSLETLKQIFAGKSQIEYFGINIEPLTIEEILELIMNFSSKLKKLSVSDLHLNITEAELFVRNFPNLRYLNSDVPISQNVLNVLQQNNITFKKSIGSKNT